MTPNVFAQHAEIEAGEMEDLEDRLVGEQPLDIGRLALGSARDLHDIGGAIARRKLHDAEPIAVRIEAHGLGVDRHRALVGARDREDRRDAAGWSFSAMARNVGAQERTRTSTPCGAST